jgi:signal transduction histidine kinase
LAKKKEISLEKKVGNQVVWADEDNLQEMLWIFLDNSVKYTPRGGKVTIETESDKRWLIIQVKDTGIGIAKEDIPHIFDRFYRADQSRSKEKVDGFGLGLSLAKTIIEMHKGTVEVSSVLGKKTTFTIKLSLKHS